MSKESPLAPKEPEKSPSVKNDIQSLIDKAQNHAAQHQAKKTRLNQSFLNRLQLPNKKAEEGKEQAMLSLSNDYISLLESFQKSTNAKEAVELLEKSENLWQKQSKTILKESPEEKSFFTEMRTHLFTALNNKLEGVSQKGAQTPTSENVQLACSILKLQDNILEEKGLASNDPRRVKIQELKNAFIR